MAIAFQANAFQTSYPSPFYAFQAADRIVNIPDGSFVIREFLHIELGPLMEEHARTTAIVFEATIYDPSTEPPSLLDPTTIQLTVIRPDDTLVLNLQAMTKISTGFYRHIWQTVSNEQLGFYRAHVKATSGGSTSQTIAQGAFKLVTV